MVRIPAQVSCAAALAVALFAACATASASSKDSDAASRLAARLAEVDAKARLEPEPRHDDPSKGGIVQTTPVAFVGGTVMTAAGDIYTPGYVVLDGGRIEAVGPGSPATTEGLHVVDATGHWVTPGLIDTHSHLGVYPAPRAKAHSDGNEMTNPNTAGVWAEHSIWPQDPGWQRALAGGVVTAHVLPGSANLVGGRSVTVRTLPTRGSRGMRYPGALDGVKIACGENPKRVYGEGRKQAPATRMGNVRGHRQAFIKAKAYLDKLEAEGPGAAHDPDLETLARLMAGEALLQVHCYRADDMLAFLQVADEFGVRVRSFHHALEAYKIRDVLAEYGISVSTWADWWGFKMEAYDGIPENAAMVAAAGGRAVVHSDSPIGIQRLNQEAAKAWHSGRQAGLDLTENEALRWITANAAWTLGIEDDTGTLEVGKRGDVVVWTAHPFSVYAKARYVFMDGLLRWDMSRATERWSDFEVGHDAGHDVPTVPMTRTEGGAR